MYLLISLGILIVFYYKQPLRYFLKKSLVYPNNDELDYLLNGEYTKGIILGYHNHRQTMEVLFYTSKGKDIRIINKTDMRIRK